MTHKQYVIDQTEIRMEMAGNKCAYCNKLAQGRAHKIPQRFVKKYGWLIIDHWLNFYMTCHKCNSKAQINTNNKQAINKQFKQILKTILLELGNE